MNENTIKQEKVLLQINNEGKLKTKLRNMVS